MGLSVVLVSTFLLYAGAGCVVYPGVDGDHIGVCYRGAFLRTDSRAVGCEQAGSGSDHVYRRLGPLTVATLWMVQGRKTVRF